MHQLIGERPVICHNQNARRIVIEPSHRVHPLLHRSKVVGHHPPVTVILRGGNDPPRFIEHVVHLFFLVNCLAINRNYITRGDLDSQRRHLVTINRHPARLN